MVSCEPGRDVDARRRTAELPLPPKVAHAVGLALRGWILRTRRQLGSNRRRKPCGSTVPATRVDRTPASWPLAVATDTARTVASPPGPRTPGGGRRRSKCPSQPSAAVSPRQRRSTDAGVPSLGGLRPRPSQLPGLRRCTPSRRRHRRAQHRPRPRKPVSKPRRHRSVDESARGRSSGPEANWPLGRHSGSPDGHPLAPHERLRQKTTTPTRRWPPSVAQTWTSSRSLAQTRTSSGDQSKRAECRRPGDPVDLEAEVSLVGLDGLLRAGSELAVDVQLIASRAQRLLETSHVLADVVALAAAGC